MAVSPRPVRRVASRAAAGSAGKPPVGSGPRRDVAGTGTASAARACAGWGAVEARSGGHAAGGGGGRGGGGGGRGGGRWSRDGGPTPPVQRRSRDRATTPPVQRRSRDRATT